MKSNGVFVFLGGQDVLRGVFDSHNIAFLSNLYSCGFFPFSTVMMTIIVKKHMTAQELLIVDRKVKTLTGAARDNGVDMRVHFIKERTLGNVVRTAQKISREISSYGTRFIWAHNYYNGLIGCLLKQESRDAYFHLDLKGLPAEEELIYSDSSFLHRALKYLSLKSFGACGIRNADSVSVVSSRYKSHLYSRHSLPGDSVFIIPSIFDTARFYVDEDLRAEYRIKYGIEKNQILLLYSGGVQKWQQPASIFRLFENLHRNDRDSGLRYLFLTLRPEEARSIAGDFKIPNLIVDSATGRDLTGAYNAADVGVICRKNDPVNNFASPTKVAEYLATRNSVLLTKSVGDYGVMMEGKAYALVKSSIEDFTATRNDEIASLSSPTAEDMEIISSSVGSRCFFPLYRSILSRYTAG